MRISDWSSDVVLFRSDGGTRTASISGAWVALRLAVNTLVAKELISEDPIVQKVAAISCGIYNGTPVIDFDYDEDSNAGADANFVLTSEDRKSVVEGMRVLVWCDPGVRCIITKKK